MNVHYAKFQKKFDSRSISRDLLMIKMSQSAHKKLDSYCKNTANHLGRELYCRLCLSHICFVWLSPCTENFTVDMPQSFFFLAITL